MNRRPQTAYRWQALLALVGILLVVGPCLAAEPPVVAAAKTGDLAELLRLLDRGADPDQTDLHNNTALIFAARDGRLAMAEALIEAGADVDRVDGEGVTPLILAAHRNRPAIARLLLARGAASGLRDKWGRRALDYALRRGEEDAIAAMIGAQR